MKFSWFVSGHEEAHHNLEKNNFNNFCENHIMPHYMADKQ